MEKLIKNYEDSVNAILDEFKKKHDMDNEDGYWIANQVGEVYDFGNETIFDFRDILTDIKENSEKDEIHKWANYMKRVWSINNMVGGVYLKEINYKSWLKGCPRISDEDLERIDNKWKVLVDDVVATSDRMKQEEKKENKEEIPN